MKTVLLSLFLLLTIAIATAQVTYTTNPTIQAITSLLQGNDVAFSNVTTDCNTNAFGFLYGSGIGLIPDTSLALSTGYISGLAKPNSSNGESWQTSGLGDPDFSVLGAGNSNDACVVEFDVVPAFNTIQFDFTFGSEDHPEIINGIYQDICAIFVSGPGISGMQNFALVPGMDTLVSSGTITPTMNTTYYADNTGGSDLEYDGFTTRLRGVVPVQAGSTYHFKIGVVDMGDQVYDSGLFIGKGDIWSEQQVGIEPAAIPELSVYPNPIHSKALIELRTTSSNGHLFQLFNTEGRLVQSLPVIGNQLIFNRGNLAAGIYLATIQSPGAIHQTRLVLMD